MEHEKGCSSWCNSYTCDTTINFFDAHCGGCDVCTSTSSMTAPPPCSSWCNSYTCDRTIRFFDNHCGGCDVCNSNPEDSTPSTTPPPASCTTYVPPAPADLSERCNLFPDGATIPDPSKFQECAVACAAAAGCGECEANPLLACCSTTCASYVACAALAQTPDSGGDAESCTIPAAPLDLGERCNLFPDGATEPNPSKIAECGAACTPAATCGECQANPSGACCTSGACDGYVACLALSTVQQ